MCLGNDTSHARRDDFSARNRVPACALTFSKKRLCRFFDSLGFFTPNPPAQNRRLVVSVSCNRAHVTVPDINLTWESNPTHSPVRYQTYVPICSGTGSVTPAFCAAITCFLLCKEEGCGRPECAAPAAFLKNLRKTAVNRTFSLLIRGETKFRTKFFCLLFF